MFLHWGLYSLLGRGEWVKYHEGIPTGEYRELASRFTAQKYRPAEWAALARRAGMRYMVLTTKHHDGFCLFSSKYSDFTAAKTAAGRDLVEEYVEACRREGLGVGLYFSVKDWSFPAYFRGPENDPAGWSELVGCFHSQVEELMTNYGKIDILFYDGDDDANFRGGWGEKTADVWKSEELDRRVRRLQPDILINNRCGLRGDYGTPEQEIPMTNKNRARKCECCLTMNDSWGYTKGDLCWKSTPQLLHNLTACAARGYNLLLNVGPDGDGVIPPEAVERLQEIGLWMDTHGEAVYGTECALPDWWDFTSAGRITTRGNTAYLLLEKWSGSGELTVNTIQNRILSAELMATGEKLSVERRGRQTVIGGLPVQPPFPWMNVIKAELDAAPQAQFYY